MRSILLYSLLTPFDSTKNSFRFPLSNLGGIPQGHSVEVASGLRRTPRSGRRDISDGTAHNPIVHSYSTPPPSGASSMKEEL